MNLYGRGEITSSPIDWAGFAQTGTFPPPGPYIVTAADGTVTTVPYAGADDPWADALAVLGLKRRYRACPTLASLREGWDDHDPWGSAMSAAGTVCDLMTIVGIPVPPELDYQPAGLPTMSELISSDDVELAALAHLYAAGEIDAADLTHAALILNRYIDAAVAAGRSY